MFKKEETKKGTRRNTRGEGNSKDKSNMEEWCWEGDALPLSDKE